MKRDQQSMNERHKQIIALVQERGKTSVGELANRFDVSLMTIRRDLQTLDSQGLLNRVHGGAMSVEEKEEDKEKKNQANGDLTKVREAISRYAAGLINDHDFLFINGSMTGLDSLKFIGEKPVSVFTNNSRAVVMDLPEQVNLTLTGGSARGANKLLIGDYALYNVLMTHTDKAFIGVDGISPNGEILCGIPGEVSINENMISHAYEYYILADHTKIGRTGTYASITLERKGTVITDNKADPDVLAELEKNGMKVIIVDPEEMTTS